jgi:hypothetical protein
MKKIFDLRKIGSLMILISCLVLPGLTISAQNYQETQVEPAFRPFNPGDLITEKPLLHPLATPLLQNEIYEIDSLTNAERQFIENSTDPPLVGVVRELPQTITFRITPGDIPAQGEIHFSGGRLSRINAGEAAWTILIRSVKADRLRLYISEGNFPYGTKVNLFSSNGHDFRQKELQGKVGEYGFYTTSIFADHLVLQVVFPTEFNGEFYFSIPRIIHAENRYIITPSAPLTCYEDANCAYANGYTGIEGLQNSVAKLYFATGGGGVRRLYRFPSQ